MAISNRFIVGRLGHGWDKGSKSDGSSIESGSKSMLMKMISCHGGHGQKNHGMLTELDHVGPALFGPIFFAGLAGHIGVLHIIRERFECSPNVLIQLDPQHKSTSLLLEILLVRSQSHHCNRTCKKLQKISPPTPSKDVKRVPRIIVTW